MDKGHRAVACRRASFGIPVGLAQHYESTTWMEVKRVTPELRFSSAMLDLANGVNNRVNVNDQGDSF